MIRLMTLTMHSGPGAMGTGRKVWYRDVERLAQAGAPLVGQVVHIFGSDHVEPEVVSVYWQEDLVPVVELQHFVIDPTPGAFEEREATMRSWSGKPRHPFPIYWETENDGSLFELLQEHGWRLQ